MAAIVERIDDTRAAPWSRICALQVQSGSSIRWSTGWLLDPALVITAAHVLNPLTSFSQVTVCPGRVGGTNPFGSFRPIGWDRESGPLGMAALFLDADAPVGSFQAYAPAPQALASAHLVTAGYRMHDGRNQWSSTAEVTTDGDELLYDAATEDGQSGSPVWVVDDWDSIVAIHNGTHRAIRLTDSRIGEMKRWLEQTAAAIAARSISVRAFGARDAVPRETIGGRPSPPAAAAATPAAQPTPGADIDRLAAALKAGAATTTVRDDTFFDSYRLAYKELDAVAADIIDRVKRRNAGCRAVVIRSDDAVAAVAAYALSLKAGPQAPLATGTRALIAAPLAASAVAGILGVLKTETETVGRDLTMEASALIASLARQGLANSVDVFWPDLFVPEIDDEALTLVEPLQQPERVRPLLLGRRIAGLFESHGALWLSVKILKAGGTRELRTSVLKNLFGGPQPMYSGGVIVQSFLTDHKGTIVDSEVFVRQSSYERPVYTS